MPYNVTSWQEAIVSAGATVIARLVSFLPNLIGAVAIFVFGWMISSWGAALIVRMLKALHLGRLVEGTAVNTFLRKAEIQGKVEDVIGAMVRWVIAFIFFIAAINVLGLSTVSSVLNSILAYIPKVISATLILLAGVLLAGVIERVVKGATGAVDVSTSRLFGKLSSWVVVIFSLLAAISELGIAAQFIQILIVGAVTTISLGLGLAIGLGSKDLVRQMLEEKYRRLKRDLKTP